MVTSEWFHDTSSPRIIKWVLEYWCWLPKNTCSHWWSPQLIVIIWSYCLFKKWFSMVRIFFKISNQEKLILAFMSFHFILTIVHLMNHKHCILYDVHFHSIIILMIILIMIFQWSHSWSVVNVIFTTLVQLIISDSGIQIALGKQLSISELT